MVSAFCARLSWSDLEALVAKFQQRVWFGVRPEVRLLRGRWWRALPFV
jgi:DNA polymerase theta